MKFSLTLFLAMALSLSPFAGRGPGCPSYLSWVCSCDQKVLPEEQHRVVTKSQSSTRRGWFGLTSCPIRVEDKNNNEIHPEEPPVEETKSETSTWRCWLGLTSCPVRNEEKNNNKALPEEQPMEETNSQTSTWRCWLGLTSCPVRIEDTKNNQVLPAEQPVEETKSQTSSRHSWFGLTSFPTRMEDRKDNQALPEEQRTEETKSQTSTWRCWFGLTSCPIGTKDTKTNQVLPEEQRTEKTKSQTSYWSCLLGSSQCPPWVWYKGSKVAVPQGPKQQAPGTKQKAYSLPGILGHLWDYLMQRGSTWLLTAPSTIFSILWLLTTARAHWRRLRRPRGQVSNQDTSGREGTVAGEQGTIKAIYLKTSNKSRPPEIRWLSPGTCPATGLSHSGRPLSNTGCATGSVSPTGCPEQSCEAGNAPHQSEPCRVILCKTSLPPFHCAHALSLPGNGTSGPSFLRNRGNGQHKCSRPALPDGCLHNLNGETYDDPHAAPREKCQEPAVQEDGARHGGQEESLHRLLRELAEVTAKPLSAIHQRS